jgi:Protein of unknown function (DUF4254)
MSLLHPTPGEMHDRLCVINLKILAFFEASKDTSRLKSEEIEIMSHLKSVEAMDGFFLSDTLLDLVKVNSEIWAMEDEIRNAGEDTVEHLALIAKRIARYNDERNRLIREIDKAYGCENPVEEKIYGCTAPK